MTEVTQGARFGRWVAVSKMPLSTSGRRYWECVCDCGTRRAVDPRKLRKGKTKSCGCGISDGIKKWIAENGGGGVTHGMSRTPAHSCWTAMLKRCTSGKPGDGNYENYLLRGITVCERWRKFENFLEDMGERPTLSHSLDRFPNRSGNYEPGNVRWATSQQQNTNRKSSVFISFGGETLTISEWARRVGISSPSMRNRLSKWPIHKALTEKAVYLNGHYSNRTFKTKIA